MLDYTIAAMMACYAIHRQQLVVKPLPSKKTVTYRTIYNIDLNQLCQHIEASTLCSELSDNLEDIVNQYDNVLAGLIDSHAPLQSRGTD